MGKSGTKHSYSYGKSSYGKQSHSYSDGKSSYGKQSNFNKKIAVIKPE